ncbi:TRAP transporter large permease [Shouchella hunanensis]|uniref:TRAP transporter large permease n=1 Tax=Shouchella hunanensis TaxID=766894 RepID=A0ABY7W302_9BACI|nr:TRAP transporter large permease [Shouchella hunanensis]WDF02305.1 TRAP transporter large permease [Shouchella hunanensis]
MTAVVLFGSFASLLALSAPIGIALILASLLALLVAGNMPFEFAIQSFITAIDSFPIMAVPFFILAGELMAKGGLSRRLFVLAKTLVGNFTGGFAMAAVITCLFFSAISGSGPATVAAVGGIMIPAMIEMGYDRRFATALIAAAGALGVILPPSIPLIVYGVTSGVSVGDLFIAAVIPGLIVTISLLIYSFLYAKAKGYKGSTEGFSIKEVGKAFWDAKWALLVPFIILGGIYSGFFTPTEAAAVAVVYGLLAGFFLYKELKWHQLYDILRNSALTTATILFIIAAATVFGRVMTIEQMPGQIASSILSISDNQLIIILLITAMLLVVGTVMDTTAAIIIFTPLLVPVGMELGYDPIHFAMLVVLNLAIGFITPPIGVNLFVASSISNLSIVTLSKAALPFVCILIFNLLLVIFIPQLSLFLLGR